MLDGVGGISGRELAQLSGLEGSTKFRLNIFPDGSTEIGKTMHPATEHILKFFAYQHLPPHLQGISRSCHDLAFEMVEQLPENPELTTGLRKLLEAKDCFVRANVRPGDHCGTKIAGGETFRPDAEPTS